jgi:phosphoglycolate phosphatase-like HAD superfamily hydrolase
MNRTFDGVPELLEELKAAGRPGGRDVQVRTHRAPILEHFGLDGYFEVIAGASPDGVRSAKADVVPTRWRS